VDTPKRFTPGVTAFESYLVLHFREEEPKTIYLLEDASFSWRLLLVEQGPLLAIYARPPTPVPNANTPENAAYLETALANAGFADWTVEPALSFESGGSSETLLQPTSPVEDLTGGFPGFPTPGVTAPQDRWSTVWERAPQAPSSSVDWQSLSASPGAQNPPGVLWERIPQAPSSSVDWQSLSASPVAQNPLGAVWERTPQAPSSSVDWQSLSAFPVAQNPLGAFWERIHQGPPSGIGH